LLGVSNTLTVRSSLIIYHKALHKSDGLTLIENLIAMAIFALGMLGIASLTLTITGGRTFSQRMTTATMLAQDKLEDVQKAVYTAIASERETIVAADNVPYERILEVSEGLPGADMKTVAIVVVWQARGARQHRVTLSTIIADRD
jgi:prepilin-type N-terminal cleavage/methylation domain-containing protein